MSTAKKTFNTVDEYIACYEPELQTILHKIRSVIHKAAPMAKERISYGMPLYEYGGIGRKGELIYFAAFKKHISMFIPPHKELNLPNELKQYHVSKATFQFPLHQPFPFKLLEKTVKLLVKLKDTQLKEETSEKVKPQKSTIHKEILAYNNKLSAKDKEICDMLAFTITKELADSENKIWHAHPVWFLDGNPIVGYSKQKKGIRLMFWSGASFDEEGLNVRGGKFKDASIFYNNVAEINIKNFKRWLKKSKAIQWDYKNLVKKKGKLERLK